MPNNLTYLSDTRAIFQVIGCLLKKPSLLDEVQFPLTKEDFPEQFHCIVFACINNLYADNVKHIDHIIIDNFLSNYPQQYKIFKDNRGIEWIITAFEKSALENFNYNYETIKKFTLLRQYQSNGVDVSDIYNDKIISPKKQEEMQKKFDNMSLQDIANQIDKKIFNIKENFIPRHGSKGQHASEGMMELKENLKKEPEMGAPLTGGICNTVCRGARLKKLYLRSAPSGVGKTRLSLGDATNLAVNEIYDSNKNEWVYNGVSEPVLFITTELEVDEVQTPMMAFTSNVNEEIILDGAYKYEEEHRVDRAIDIINKSPIYIEHMANFNMQAVERTIRRYVYNYGVKYVFFDYIHTSIGMLMEIAQSSRGVRLREDNVLFMFATRLKDICNELGVFIYTATQVNGMYKSVKEFDENLLRGAKAIADKVDVGIIAMDATKSDLLSVQHITSERFGYEPNMIYHVYKNRRGKWKNIRIWSYVDLGTCRQVDLFMTDNDYKLIPIESTKIDTFLSDSPDKSFDQYNLNNNDLNNNIYF